MPAAPPVMTAVFPARRPGAGDDRGFSSQTAGAITGLIGIGVVVASHV
jgi:hypothetical protein